MGVMKFHTDQGRREHVLSFLATRWQQHTGLPLVSPPKPHTRAICWPHLSACLGTPALQGFCPIRESPRTPLTRCQRRTQLESTPEVFLPLPNFSRAK